MDGSILGNGSMGNNMVKEHTLGLHGDKYVGEYKDGERHGQGTYTWSDGSKYVGEYEDGEPWNGTYYDKNGKIKGKFVNGVLQK